MGILTILLIVYLVIGVLYALYILFFGGDLWYAFPINVFFWLPGTLYTIYKELTRQRQII